MPAFTDDFASTAAWVLETGGETGHFIVATPPVASPYGSSTAAIIHDNTGGGGGFFAQSRLDLVDGGDPTRTDWLAWAFFIEDWADITDSFFMFSLGFTNDPDTQSGNGVYITSLDAGNIQGPYAPAVAVSDGEWHTARVGGRVDTGGVGEAWFYLDDVLIDHSTGIGLPGFMNTGTWGPAVYDDVNSDTHSVVYVSALTWSPGEDPGEPVLADTTPGGYPVVVCGSGLSLRSFIAGNEVTNIGLSGSYTPRLNRPAQATITLPMESATGDVGSLLKMVLTDGNDEEIVFHGPILNSEVDTAEDGGTIVYNAQDHMELWQHRVVRADDADFSKPVGSGLGDGTDLIATYGDAPSILQAMLINTVQNPDGPNGGGPPTDAEGPIFLDLGSFASGGASMAGAPVDWPMTIADFYALLVSTGQLDAVITYTDPGGGVTGTIDAYNGNFGADLSSSVRFEYGTGLFSASHVRWNRDGTNMVNKYQIFAGPRVETASDPAGDQHWCFNITGFDGGSLAGFTGGLPYPPGGQSVDTSNNEEFGGDPNNPLGHKIYSSRQTYGVRMRIDVMDAFDDNCIPNFGSPGRMLLRRQWQVFSWFACEPRELVHITPTADTFIGCFHIGDLVHVEAVSDVAGGFSGAQRVYEYTVSWDGTPSVLTLSEIQTSADAEGSGG